MTAPPVRLRQYPGSRRLFLHPDAGRRTRSIRTLTGSSDWRRDLVDRFGAAAVAVTGPRIWPIAPTIWSWPPMTPDELVERLRTSLPGLRLIGAAVPRQPGRRRLSLFCRYAGNSIVVKLGVDQPGKSMQTEARVLVMLSSHPLPGIETPDVVAAGQLVADDVTIDYVATAAIGVSAQRPAVDVALRTFEADLAERLATLDPLGADVTGLVPVHGDLTPWNLRRTRRGLALFDWEAAGWGQPGSDLACYRQACGTVRPWWQRARPGVDGGGAP